ncbi:MAG: dTMP kinase [Thermoprotei archaeon]|nr:MAG: dTMP kinase [Thermoprotei archaeon]
MSGVYVSFDGVDGAGSTTHTRLLAKWLRSKGLKVFETKEPTTGRIGSLIRAYLREGSPHPAVDALLFAADRVEHSMRIKSMLDEGFIVVSDRSIISSLAYQQAQGLDYSWILEVNKYSLKPHMPIILDIDPEISLARKKEVKEKFENSEFLRAVRDNMLKLARENGWAVVDTSKPLDSAVNEVRRLVAHQFKKFGVIIDERP